MEICSGHAIKVEKEEFYRQVSAQLEELDYRELYSAYSKKIRKSQVEPRILFEILVCAYALGEYSTRRIEQLCRNHVQFILILDGHAAPDHTTISRFLSGKGTGKAIGNLFEQYARQLEAKGETNHEMVFIDGTKIESRANRYTFVWRKQVERELKKIKEKLRGAMKAEGEEGYLTRNKAREYLERLNAQIEEAGLVVLKGRGHRKPKLIRLRDEVAQQIERWDGYEEKLRLLGEGRNSYSKTDPDATFMHMKDDHMRNGQLKPGYNLQFAVNSEYIVGLGLFSDRTDYGTMKPMMERMKEIYGSHYGKAVMDSGYESLANYRYLNENKIEAYIKPNNYESQKKRMYKAQIGRAENMAYYKPGDYFLCKAGRMLVKVGTSTEKSKDGTEREKTRYRCEDCHACPYRAACCKAKDPEQQKELVICWEMQNFRNASQERITSEEGKLLRVNRSIQAEGSFAQLKHNRGFDRFLTFGKRKALTALYILAISQNVMKYISKCNAQRCKTHILQPKELLKF